MAKKIHPRNIEISISVVSHLHSHLIFGLFKDLHKHCKNHSIEVILTLNKEEELPFSPNDFFFPMRIIKNSIPKGFAQNHNQAFKQIQGEFFCILNPDIRLQSDPFPGLLECLKQNKSVGIASPKVTNEKNEIEDSARYFPTPLKILCKLFGKCRGSDYLIQNGRIYPDWVAGMFMLIPSEIFRRAGHFNEGFFLYYEDVDLCARLRLLGYEIALCPDSVVIHHAQRTSHHNFQFLWWHLKSMAKFFTSIAFFKIMIQKIKKMF